MCNEFSASAGLLFFELMFLTFRSMFTALFTFPEVNISNSPCMVFREVHAMFCDVRASGLKVCQSVAGLWGVELSAGSTLSCAKSLALLVTVLVAG